MTHQYEFFSHRNCEFFPCHKTDRPQDFNCLFCYCPLYAFGPACGGNYRFTKEGRKDCSACMFPHRRENYHTVQEKLEQLIRTHSAGIPTENK